jgi:hypothetical protein
MEQANDASVEIRRNLVPEDNQQGRVTGGNDFHAGFPATS